MTMLEALQDARSANKPVKDTFCDWNEVELRAAMEKDAKAVRGRNGFLLHVPYGKPSAHASAQVAMRQIGEPCTIQRLMSHMGITRTTANDYMRNLMLRGIVTNDRNELGQVIYRLRGGYTGQREMEI